MALIAGLDRFREAMRGWEDYYVLIGGGACSLLFDEQQRDFRATRDLDLVILSNKADASFARTFWAFVQEGGYQCGSRSNGGVRYYRFILSPDSVGYGYPAMIELFAKHPDFSLANEESAVAPLPFDETVSSLSAIILDDGYYDFICSGVLTVRGISTLDALHIIPLKMRAHIDLNARYAQGERVDGKDLRKHRADAIALSDLLPNDAKLPLSGQMSEDARLFLEDVEAYASRITRRRDRLKAEQAASFLRSVYLD